MSFLNKIFEKAKNNPKKIVLPEGDDERIIEAGLIAANDGIAKITIIGNYDKINEVANKKLLSIKKIEIIDKNDMPNINEYAEEYYHLRKSKNIKLEEAFKVIKDPLFYSAMLVRKNIVDGMVAGAINTTANVCRAILHIVGLKSGIKVLSSFFIMILPDKSFGNNGILFYADCGVVIDPDINQLADIAISTAESYKMYMDDEPKVAMLSFSTKGSANSSQVVKVKKALEIAKLKKPDLIVDGELQVDAALVPSVAEKKSKDSIIAGRANVLIFPNLEAGNIAYKLTERLAKAEALGPLLQGSAKPCSDLSRGCKTSDILNIIALNVIRCQYLEEELNK